MKTINEIFLYILQSICYMLGSILIFTFLCDYLLYINPNFNIIFILTMLFYCIIFILTEVLEKVMNIDLLESKIFIGISILAILAAGLVSGYKESFLAIVFLVVYFTIVWLVAIRANRSVSIDSIKASVYFKLIRSFAITILMASFYISEKEILAFGNKTIDFVVIYFAASILYVICLNYNEHYETSSAINKDKNILVLNSLVVVLTSITIFFRKQIMLLVKMFKEYIEPGTDAALNNIIEKVNSFVENMLKTDAANYVLENMDRVNNIPGGEVSPLENGAFEAVEEAVKKSNSDIIYKIVFAVFLIIVLYILFKKLRKYMYKKRNKGGFEEREFIFKREEFFNDIKNSLANMFKKRENLSPERLLYKKTVNELINEGYEISRITTPNEYIDTIVEDDAEKYNFNEITSAYNDYRYGKDNK